VKVPLVDLRASYLPIREPLLRSFDAILDGMQLFLGPNVQAFEKEFAAYCEAAHGIGLSNGTDAISAALRACDVGPGDEVIAPSHTFFATIEAIVHVGATPVLVDVTPDTLTIDPSEVAAAVTPATKAIVPVHLYGHPADMDPILAVARRHRLRVIEDAAQAHGARYRGRRCGSMGDAASFSFYFTKNLGAFGEGGFVTTNDGAIGERVRLLRHHGHVSKFEHAIVGYNLRLDELQAAVLRLKLPRLDAGNARRREIAARYRARFAGSGIGLLRDRPDSEPVQHVFPIMVDDRDAVAERLTAAGVGTGIHYRNPAHLQPALAAHPHRVGRMTVTERACARLLSIPMYPELADEQVEHVASAVLAAAKVRGVAAAGTAAERRG
jgi:dTDP-4-amino-4,6-dideoxygalactose transaminase